MEGFLTLKTSKIASSEKKWSSKQQMTRGKCGRAPGHDVEDGEGTSEEGLLERAVGAGGLRVEHRVLPGGRGEPGANQLGDIHPWLGQVADRGNENGGVGRGAHTQRESRSKLKIRGEILV